MYQAARIVLDDVDVIEVSTTRRIAHPRSAPGRESLRTCRGHDEARCQDHSCSRATAQRRLGMLQWVVPVLTGVLPVLNARQREQQRPTVVAGASWTASPRTTRPAAGYEMSAAGVAGVVGAMRSAGSSSVIGGRSVFAATSSRRWAATVATS